MLQKILWLTALFVSAQLSADPKQRIIAITQIVEHQAADDVRNGIIDELKSQGFEDKKNIKVIYDNAQSNPATALAIATKFRSLKPDIVVGITTPSAQALVNVFKHSNTPLVFSAVTDPIKARLIKNMKKPEGYITGTSDMPPVKKQLALIQKILPHVQKIAVLYNPGESNSVSILDKIKEHATGTNLKIIDIAVLKSTEISTATHLATAKADAIYVPLDNMLTQSIESILNIANTKKIPVFTAESSTVKKGALAALGFDHAQLGHQTGKQIVQILKGTKIADIPVMEIDNEDLFLNQKTAEKLGITLQDELLQKAKWVVK